VKLKGIVPDDELRRLARGVRLEDGTTAPCTIKKLGKLEKNSWLEVTLREGRYRQVRRMFETGGHTVLKLRRVGYAGLALGDLPVGRCRRLSGEEIASLRRDAVGRPASHRR
jgi:23S rRNA pseudouridine2605 synthase